MSKRKMSYSMSQATEPLSQTATQATFKRRRTDPSTKKYVRMALNRAIETKERRFGWNDITNLGSVSYGGSSAYAVLYSDISQGLAQNNRIGNVITATGVSFQLSFAPGDSHNQLRFLILTTKGQGGTNESFSDPASLIQNIMSGNASSTTQYLSPVDTSRWKVLYDRVLTLRYITGDGTVVAYPLPQTIKKFIPLNKKIIFDDEGQAPRNDIYVIAISDSSAVAHPGAIAGNIVAYYKDG